jgi:hypothetical protein
MLSSLLRPKRGRRRSSATPLLFRGFHALRNVTPSAEDTSEDESEYDDAGQYDEGESEDNDDAGRPILPIFSAPLLGRLRFFMEQQINANDRISQIKSLSTIYSIAYASSWSKNARLLCLGNNFGRRRCHNSW